MDETTYNAYLEHLISGDRAACAATVETLLDEETPVRELYQDLFQRSMYDVGRMWETNRISVAVEHLATAITERLMTLVYPRMFRAEHTGYSAIVSCAPGERHQIGARMVADFFELHGWDGHFLGADTPREAVLDMVRDKQPDMVAFSASLRSSVPAVFTVASAVRENYPEIPVIVGGQGFRDLREPVDQTVSGVRYLPSLVELEDLVTHMV